MPKPIEISKNKADELKMLFRYERRGRVVLEVGNKYYDIRNLTHDEAERLYDILIKDSNADISNLPIW